MRIALLFLALSTTAAQAQSNPCVGLESVRDGAKPVYPPIAKAAHVEGEVMLLVSFKTTGEVDTVHVVSAPPMLQQAAMDYAKAWRANQYDSSRTCQMQITYLLPPTIVPPAKCKSQRGFVKRTDAQHVKVKGGGYICMDVD